MGKNIPGLSPEEFAELIENIPDLILSIEYPSGDINYINTAALAALGVPSGSITNIKQLAKNIPLDYRKKILSKWRDVTDDILYPSITFKMETADGITRWIEDKNIYIKDRDGKTIRIHAILRDISERKRLEEEMMQSFYFSENLFLYAPYAIIHFTTDGSIKRFNKAFRGILDFNDHTFKEYNLWEDPQLKSEGIEILLREVLKGRIMEIPPYRYTATRDSNTVTFTLSGKAFPYLGDSVSPSGLVLMLEDVTDKRKKEHEYMEAKKLESIGRLARGVAHEFNNILAGISGFSEILLRKISQDDPNFGFVKKIHDASMKAATLTNQLLGFARGQIYNPSYLDIHSPIMFALGATPGIHRNITIEKNTESSGYWVFADVNQIRQVFIELFRNASEAIIDSGTIRIDVSHVDSSELQDQLVDSAENKFIQVSITDTGNGMDHETISHAFEPYFTTRESSKHAGMGLAIAYGHLKRHGGNLSIQSSPGTGTTALVLLPEATPPSGHTESTIPYNRVLIIDDSEETTSMLKTYLEDRGCYVQNTSSGKAGIELIKNNYLTFDLIFLDLVIPDVSGKEVLHTIRHHKMDIPVILISGTDAHSILEDFTSDKNLHVLLKPFSLEDLEAMLG